MTNEFKSKDKLRLMELESITQAANRGGTSPLVLLQRMGRLFEALENQWWVSEKHVMTYDDPDRILKAAQRCHESSGHAAAFCMAVYNWNKNKFDFVRAMSEMAPSDREIICAWGVDPFYL